MAPEYLDQPWSVDKVLSVLAHLIIPTIVIGTAGTAGMIRRLRANLLDELHKQYVTTARSKGMKEGKLLIKYPLRMAINPFIADIGSIIPSLVSGSVIVSVVLNLPTVGPILLTALQSQDQFLAGSVILFVALLTLAGMLISDLLLAVVDPRIRLGQGAKQVTNHYVDPEPFDPHEVMPSDVERERYFQASQWQIIWWKFPPTQAGARRAGHPVPVLPDRALRRGHRALWRGPARFRPSLRPAAVGPLHA